MRSRIERARFGVAVALAAGVAGFGLQGCGAAASPTNVADLASQSSFLSMRTVLESQNSAAEEPERLVIRDQATWDLVWAGLLGTPGAPATQPFVDFRKEIVLVAALGTKPNAGYTVSLGPTVQVDNAVTATVRKQVPGARCGSADMVTHPLSIATIPRTDLRVEFVENEQVNDCM